ncbi:unnamed protein product, partial [Polarella glacialis]
AKPKKPIGRPCIVMAVLENKEAGEALLKMMPVPLKSDIKGRGIMILRYAPGEERSCCEAHNKLSRDIDVKSVGYDGLTPDCRAAFAEPPSEGLVGGFAEPSEVTEESLEIWRKVVEKQPVAKNIDLAALGDPESVELQVVAGINYNFRFVDGTVVTVFHQPWSSILEVSRVKQSGGAARQELR